MATIPGTYIEKGQSLKPRINEIVDILLTPHLVEFRQIMIYYENGVRLANNKFRFTYQNWNAPFPVEIFLNGGIVPLNSSSYTVDYLMGIVTLNFDLTDGDNVSCSYSFSYFPIYVLEGFIYRSVDLINLAPAGPPTDYALDEIPMAWDSVVSDLVIAMCMEKLIIEYDLWKGRLIFAIGSQNLMDGGGDIIGQLSEIKHNCEDRANNAMNNEKMKVSNCLALPTRYYYEALNVGSSSRSSAHGINNYGKLRGLRLNKYVSRI